MHSPPRREAEQSIARFGVQRLPRRLLDHNEMAFTMTCEGTPDYIAPEMFSSLGDLRRNDVGVLALEVACGLRSREPQLPPSESNSSRLGVRL